MVKLHLSTAGDAGSIPGPATKIPHTAWKAFLTSQSPSLASVLHLSSGRRYRMRLSPQPLPAHASGILGFSRDSQDVSWVLLSRPNSTHRLLMNHHHGHGLLEDWNAKVGSQEIPGVTGRFGLGVQNETGQRLTLLQTSLPATGEKTLHMDITRWLTPKSG